MVRIIDQCDALNVIINDELYNDQAMIRFKNGMRSKMGEQVGMGMCWAWDRKTIPNPNPQNILHTKSVPNYRNSISNPSHLYLKSLNLS